MSNPLTKDEVLTMWLFSKVGTPRRVVPTSGNMTAAYNSVATMIVCAHRLESIPGYCEPILRGYLDRTRGIEGNAALFGVVDFLSALEASLTEIPIYPVESNEIKTEITSYTLREIGQSIGCEHPQKVKRFMEDEGFKVPGVFQFEKHWKIMSMDALKNAYRDKSKINIEIEENICTSVAS